MRDQENNREPGDTEEEAFRSFLKGLDPSPGGASTPCPSANMLAGYAAGDLLEAERVRMERHLAKCRACLKAVAEAAKPDRPQPGQ